jgi:uncharacterized membrane protein
MSGENLPPSSPDSPSAPPQAVPPVRPSRRATFGEDFKRFFTRGLAVLLPSILTLWILWYALLFVFNNVAVPINRGLRWTVIQAVPLVTNERHRPDWYIVTEQEREDFLRTPAGSTMRSAARDTLDAEARAMQFREFWQARWYLSILGLIVAITLIYLAGMLLGGLIGRRLYEAFENLISRLPGFKHVYPHVKQLVNLVMGDHPMAFKRVVLVEYPRKGVWSIGFVTSGSMRDIAHVAGESVLSVFVPSTPTPFTGFAINVAEREVIDLPISVDEAIRFMITGGVLIPEKQNPDQPQVSAPASESPPIPPISSTQPTNHRP